jgi:hypothetical protein
VLGDKASVARYARTQKKSTDGARGCRLTHFADFTDPIFQSNMRSCFFGVPVTSCSHRSGKSGGKERPNCSSSRSCKHVGTLYWAWQISLLRAHTPRRLLWSKLLRGLSTVPKSVYCRGAANESSSCLAQPPEAEDDREGLLGIGKSVRSTSYQTAQESRQENQRAPLLKLLHFEPHPNVRNSASSQRPAFVTTSATSLKPHPDHSGPSDPLPKVHSNLGQGKA